MLITDSFELLKALKKLNLLRDKRDHLWWPNSLTFEVVVSAILTQQTKWQKVEKSLNNLKEYNLLSLDSLSNTDLKTLQTLIKPSGFYNTKAKRLQMLCQNIMRDYGNFESFQAEVDREWLLAQKGLGEESSDAILCYACGREVMVVDSYTRRLLEALGFYFENYSQMQEWLMDGIERNLSGISELYGNDYMLSTIYSRFHGKIVEYAKVHIRGKKVNIEELCL